MIESWTFCWNGFHHTLQISLMRYSNQTKKMPSLAKACTMSDMLASLCPRPAQWIPLENISSFSQTFPELFLKPLFTSSSHNLCFPFDLIEHKISVCMCVCVFVHLSDSAPLLTEKSFSSTHLHTHTRVITFVVPSQWMRKQTLIEFGWSLFPSSLIVYSGSARHQNPIPRTEMILPLRRGNSGILSSSSSWSSCAP